MDPAISVVVVCDYAPGTPEGWDDARKSLISLSRQELDEPVEFLFCESERFRNQVPPDLTAIVPSLRTLFFTDDSSYALKKPCGGSRVGGICCLFGRGLHRRPELAEAVACGMPVLATHFAVRGLELEANPALVLLDKAEDWVMFLNSDRAEELGRQSSPPHIIRRFRPETHAAAVADFVRSAIDATTAPPLPTQR